ncbi:MAG: endonuclease III [Clostridiales bacterium]|jgi:endonuclease-3|nr:endonuclease III [Clostridiales bacterium]OPZ68282.1 MAG: Ultraviolet N-glycosylase/AP lyase [Firmicutes bacterium ADurb.Bin467]
MHTKNGEGIATDAQKIDRVFEELQKLYPEARPELHFSNAYEVLVATILSAQCTDKRVNLVTSRLFPKYPDAYAMAKLEPEELEPEIRECGLYHNKAKNIVAACRAIVSEHGGVVPSTREELMKLPGVGQKTAGVVLLAAFGDDQIPVDTHVFRVSRRIGLADATTAEGVEKQLRDILPRETWSHAHHLLIWHGRRMCHARGPECGRCPLRGELCQYGE